MVVRIFATETYGLASVAFAENRAVSTTNVKVGEWVDYVIDMKTYYEGGTAGWTVMGIGVNQKVDGKSVTYFSDVYFTDTKPEETTKLVYPNTMTPAGTSGGTATAITSADAAIVKDATTQAALAAEIAEKGCVYEASTPWGYVAVAGFDYNLAKEYYNVDGCTRYLVIRVYASEEYAITGIGFAKNKVQSETEAKTGEWVNYVIDMKAYYEGGEAGWTVIGVNGALKVDSKNVVYYSDIYFTGELPA